MALYDFEDLVRQTDLTHVQVSNSTTINNLSDYYNTDWNLNYYLTQNRTLTKVDGEYIASNVGTDYYYLFQFKTRQKIQKISLDLKIPTYSGNAYTLFHIRTWDIVNGSNVNGTRFALQKHTSKSSNIDVLIDVNKTDYGHYEKTFSEATDVILFGIYCDVGEFRFKNLKVETAITSNGGGATHIAKRTGLLKDLSSYTSDILMVSGGGGGGLLVGEDIYAGKDAGGISGSGNNSANQTTGYAFGQGESGTNVSGGGAGLYGGYKGGS